MIDVDLYAVTIEFAKRIRALDPLHPGYRVESVVIVLECIDESFWIRSVQSDIPEAGNVKAVLGLVIDDMVGTPTPIHNN